MPSTRQPSTPSVDSICSLLTGTPPFSNLKPETIEVIARTCDKLFYRSTEYVVHEGEMSMGFFLVLEGQLEAQQRGISLRRMGPGQFFGETSLVEGEPRSADVIATQPTFCLRISSKQFKDLMRDNPDVSTRILEEMIRRNRTVAKVLPSKSVNDLAPDEQDFEFKSELAQKAFDSRVDSFVHDYMVKKIVGEKSGWRSITDIARETRASVRGFYGKHGGMGSVLAEPINRGLIEARYFPGERGRGGEVMRFRICHEKEPVRAYVNHKIRKGNQPSQVRTDSSPA